MARLKTVLAGWILAWVFPFPPVFSQSDLIPRLYDLASGSILLDDCLNCERPVFPEPLRGTFVLTGDFVPVPGELYKMTRLRFLDTLRVPGGQILVQGVGTYHRIKEDQTVMNLALEVLGTTGVQLTSGMVAPEVPWPGIDIRVTEDGTRDPLHVFTIRIVAKPLGLFIPRFRRGDSNGDGALDISDAVHILVFSFLNGETPSCLDASDVNDDDSVDISDAIFAFEHLFQGGPAPPAPGPISCGPEEDPVEPLGIGCDDYPTCDRFVAKEGGDGK